MEQRRRPTTLALAIVSWLAASAHAWETFVPYGWSTRHVIGVQFDRPGNVIVTMLGDEVTHSGSRVVALARDGGRVRWTFDVGDSGGENQVTAVALDRRGDLVLVGRDRGREDPSFDGYFTAIKLDPAAGTVRWQPAIGVGRGHAVAFDDAGDVFVAGSREDPGRVLMKLDGNDGRLIWERHTDGIVRLVTDARGDVIASDGDTVVKVGGDDGREHWRTSSYYGVVGRIRRTNVVATRCEGQTSQVVVLRGVDGSERWRRDAPTGRSCPLRAAVFRDRDVVVAALVGSHVEVARLDGRTGTTKWHRIVTGELEQYMPQLAVGRSDIAVHTNDGLLRLSPPTGQETFRSPERGDVRSGLAVGPEGTLVLARAGDLEDGTDGFDVKTFARRLLRGRSGRRP